MSRGDTRRALSTLAAGLRQLAALRWARVVGVLVLAVLCVRIGCGWAFAFAADRLAARRGLACAWGDLDLSVLGGRARLSDLALRPRTSRDAAALVEVEYAVIDLDVKRLLLGELRVSRAEVDGVDVRLERDAAGAWSFAPYFSLEELRAVPASEDEAAVEGTREPRALDLAPPLAIDALRFQNARLHLVDRAVEPPAELELELNLALSDLRDPERPAHFSATVTGGDVLDGARLAGVAHWGSEELLLQLTAQAGSLRPAALAPYLGLLDVRPACASLSAALRAEVGLRVVGAERDELALQVKLEDVQLASDGGEALALDRLLLTADTLLGERANVQQLELAGVRMHASLQADGAFRVAGLDLLPAMPQADARPQLDALTRLGGLLAPHELPRWAALLVRPDPDALRWSLGALSVRDGRIELEDHGVAPPARFPLVIEEVRIEHVVHDPSAPSTAIPVLARLALPGLVESIRLSGEVGPFTPERKVDLELELAGLGLGGVEGYLHGAGLERAMKNGSVKLRLIGAAHTDASGRTTGSLALEELAVQDERELFGLRTLAARDIVHDPSVPLLRFGELVVAGPRITLGRDPSARFFALGLRTLGFAPERAKSDEPPAAAPRREAPPAGVALAPPPPPPPRIEIGRLAFTDSDVELVDELVTPPRTFHVDALGFELVGLTLGGDPAGPEHPPAHLSGRLSAQDVIEELQLEGTLTSRPGALDLGFELALHGRGARGELLAPYLRAIGIEPAVLDASFSGRLAGSVAEAGGAWHVDATLADAQLVEAGTLLASIERAHVADLVLGTGIDAGAIELVRPFLSLAREPGGGVHALGFRAARVGAAEDEASVSTAPPAALALPRLPELRVAWLSVADARIAWSDRALDPPLATELGLDLEVTDLRTDGAPTLFDARLSIPETIAALAVEGEARLGPDELELAARVQARGVRSGPLMRLLPPGIALESVDGRLALAVEARAAAAPEGGLTVGLAAREMAWGEDGAPPWAAFERVQLDVRRIDPVAGVLELGQLELAGLELAAQRDARGTLHALGLRLEAAREHAGAPAEPADPDRVARASTLPFARVALLEPLVLELERFMLTDARLGAGVRPLAGTLAFRLEPCTLLDLEPQALAPLEWSLTGSLAGLVERWRVAGNVAPFAPEPSFELELAAEGVRTAGLVELVPGLAARVSGVVEQGSLAGRLAGRLLVRRARPTDLGLSRPFGAELAFEGLAFREAPDGALLAGLERLDLEVKRIDLAQGFVHVRSLELTRPSAAVWRRGNVVSALGLALDLDAPPAPVDVRDAHPIEAAAPAPARAASGEVRVDRLSIAGIDFELRDETSTPPLVVPLDELDLEVQRFTTRALTERRPIDFSATLAASSPEEGAAALFEEASLAGRVALYPSPSGWARLALLGLELPPLSPLAEPQGVELADGALDFELKLSKAEARDAKVGASLVFTDLEVDEPEGGVIARALALPMPLDAALFVLQSPDGGHHFSLGFSLPEGGLGTGGLVVAGTQALAGVLGQTLVGAPLRLVTAFVPTSEGAPEVWTQAFAPGVTELLPVQRAALVEQGRRMATSSERRAVLTHRLSAEDVARAEARANPTDAECVELVAGLRQRKAELLRGRDTAAGRVRARLALGAEGLFASHAELRELERELVAVEDALDAVLEIQRSDSERRRARRTRAALLEIAQRRLDLAYAGLRQGLRDSDPARIELRPVRFEVGEGPGAGGVVVEFRER